MEDIAYLQSWLVGEVLVFATYHRIKVSIFAHIACHIFTFPCSVIGIGRRSILHTNSIMAWTIRFVVCLIFPCKQSTCVAVFVIDLFQVCIVIYRESWISHVCIIVVPSDVAFRLVVFIAFCSIIFKRQW